MGGIALEAPSKPPSLLRRPYRSCRAPAAVFDDLCTERSNVKGEAERCLPIHDVEWIALAAPKASALANQHNMAGRELVQRHAERMQLGMAFYTFRRCQLLHELEDNEVGELYLRSMPWPRLPCLRLEPPHICTEVICSREPSFDL